MDNLYGVRDNSNFYPDLPWDVRIIGRRRTGTTRHEMCTAAAKFNTTVGLGEIVIISHRRKILNEYYNTLMSVFALRYILL